VFGVQTKRSEPSHEQVGSNLFRHFGAPLTPQAPSGRHRPKTVMTQGSGFFISADGYAVTNNHVIEGSKTAEVQTDDQRTYTPRWSAAIRSATSPCSRSTAATTPLS
jgi:S1-C subfamily serine protease